MLKAGARLLFIALFATSLWASEEIDLEKGLFGTHVFQGVLHQLSIEDQKKLGALSPQECTGLMRLVGATLETDHLAQTLGRVLSLSPDKKHELLTHAPTYAPVVCGAFEWLERPSVKDLVEARTRHLSCPASWEKNHQFFYDELSHWHLQAHMWLKFCHGFLWVFQSDDASGPTCVE